MFSGIVRVRDGPESGFSGFGLGNLRVCEVFSPMTSGPGCDSGCCTRIIVRVSGLPDFGIRGLRDLRGVGVDIGLRIGPS